MKVHPTRLTAMLLCGTALAQADIVTEWNTAALNAIRVNKTAPPAASRALAITHLAVYDAVNSITLTHEAYNSYQPVVGPSSIEAAAAQAAHTALSQLFPAQKAVFDSMLTNQLAGVTDLTQRANGATIGINAANAMLSSRVGDGSASTATYNYPAAGTIGGYVATPNAYASYALPQWKDVTPFAMSSTTQFRPEGSPDINSGYYTAAYNEVKSLGANNSTARTADQTAIAYFWADGGGTATPPGHWNLVSQQVSSQAGLTIEQNARLFALLNIATADAAIAAWDAKFEDAMWRPITAIRTEDGNNDTLTDAGWTPLLATPNHPSYVSGHSTFSAAAGGILAEYFGTDQVNFSVVSEDITNLPAGYTREFDSFSEAVDEAGMSRIYGGIHFQFDNVDGQEMGYALSDYVASNYLRAVPEPSSTLLLLVTAPLLLRRRRA